MSISKSALDYFEGDKYIFSEDDYDRLLMSTKLLVRIDHPFEFSPPPELFKRLKRPLEDNNKELSAYIFRNKGLLKWVIEEFERLRWDRKVLPDKHFPFCLLETGPNVRMKIYLRSRSKTDREIAEELNLQEAFK